MKKHYELENFYPDREPLIFDWDKDTGEITGPSAREFLCWKPGDRMNIHPYGCFHELSMSPFTNYTDMAVIAGRNHKIPDEWDQYYPKWEPSEEEIEAEKAGALILY